MSNPLESFPSCSINNMFTNHISSTGNHRICSNPNLYGNQSLSISNDSYGNQLSSISNHFYSNQSSIRNQFCSNQFSITNQFCSNQSSINLLYHNYQCFTVRNHNLTTIFFLILTYHWNQHGIHGTLQIKIQISPI